MSNTDSTALPLPQSADGTPRRVRRARPQERSVPVESAPASQSTEGEQSDDGFSLQDLHRRIWRAIHSAVAAGYGLSLLIHSLLLLVMSLVIVSDFVQETYIDSSMSEPQDGVAFDAVADLKFDMPEGAMSSLDSLETAMNLEVLDDSPNPVMQGVENSVESLFNDGSSGEQGNGGASFLVPENTKVFAKGSFTAWTVPNDPTPGEDYSIVILVRLPDRVKRYRASDLSGLVVGTDGYRQAIPGPAERRGNVFLPIQDRHAQLIVKVPGGASRVRDRIEIRSLTLKEEQTLEIEF
ncbi:hypothetical protein [Rubinisphaera margarita]|uniref:hypothetical protein n=1 Tax=Rubinisphaera margarita TaxID=2909586 RepID=UPI001EE7F9D7|nr:hypothetical protein [Rubinisphaera margarita]MCG6157562.1 hypothetical protein [Rubinisphaera margarita]